MARPSSDGVGIMVKLLMPNDCSSKARRSSATQKGVPAVETGDSERSVAMLGLDAFQHREEQQRLNQAISQLQSVAMVDLD